jgi:TrfA protein
MSFLGTEVPTPLAALPPLMDDQDDALHHVSDAELRASAARLLHHITAQNARAPQTHVPATAPARRLPAFPAAARPVVNVIARSALFTCVQGKDRQQLDNVLLATVGEREIRFTGRQWNQDDHDLFMQVVHMAAHAPLGTYVRLSSYSILQALGRGTSGRPYHLLRDDLARLAGGTVHLRHTRREVEYRGHLIDDARHDEASHHWMIRLNPTLGMLYGPSAYTLIDWTRRKRLRGKDLARWLQLYLATHAAPFPMKVATLRALSGSRVTRLRDFRQMLQRALADLKDFGAITAWEIDANDLVHVFRGEAVTASQRQHLDRREKQR